MVNLFSLILFVCLFVCYYQVQHLKDLDKLVIILYEVESPTLTGDIKMKFYSSNPVSYCNYCVFQCSMANL